MANPTPPHPIRVSAPLEPDAVAELPELPPVRSSARQIATAPPLDPIVVRRRVLVVVAIVSLIGLVVEIAYANSRAALWAALAPNLSLSGEGNVPTWVSTLLLFSTALVAAAIAREIPAPKVAVLADPAHAAIARTVAGVIDRGRAIRRGWWGVAAVFAYASLDEAVQLHEHLGGHLELSGVLYYDWIIPAVGLVVIATVAFWPFLRALAVPTRNRLIVAAAIYLGGAIAMELPLGWWTDRHGVDGLGYALIDWVEETLEMIGASLALFALLAHRRLPA